MESLLQVPEASLSALTDPLRSLSLLHWLTDLEVYLKSNEDPLQESIINHIVKSLTENIILKKDFVIGPPLRLSFSKVLSALFSKKGISVSLLFETLNSLNDSLKKTEDALLPHRLCSMFLLGSLYQTFGSLTGRYSEETLGILIKGLKSGESVSRLETLKTICKILRGNFNFNSSTLKEILKVVKVSLCDRCLSVRKAAGDLLLLLHSSSSSVSFVETENLTSLLLRAFEGADYETRKSLSRTLGQFLASSIQSPKSDIRSKGSKKEEGFCLTKALALLKNGFIQGRIGSGRLSSGAPSIESRISLTYSIISFVSSLGGPWFETHYSDVLSLALESLSHVKVNSCHVDSVSSRLCIGFTLRVLTKRLLGDKATFRPLTAHIGILTKGSSSETSSLILSLMEIRALLLSTPSLVSDCSSTLPETLLTLLTHSVHSVRLYSAFTLSSYSYSAPHLTSGLLDTCLSKLEAAKNSSEGILGFSGAIAALLGSVKSSSLGIPHGKGKIIFNVGEELLRSASGNSKLSLERTNSGWLLIGAVNTLGASVIVELLPRMLLLWRNAFPRSLKDLASEKERGDAFTWKISLEARSGALASIQSFLENCGDLLTEDIIRRISVPLESSINLLLDESLLKSYGELKGIHAQLRCRFFSILCLLPPKTLAKHFTSLSQMIFNEILLCEGVYNSLYSQLISTPGNSSLLSRQYYEPEECELEEQFLGGIGSGLFSLEHDVSSLYRSSKEDKGSLPLGVQIIDASIAASAHIFPHLSSSEQIFPFKTFLLSESKLKNPSKSLQIHSNSSLSNILTLLLLSLMKSSKGSHWSHETLRASLLKILGFGLCSPEPYIRIISGESFGRLAKAVSLPSFVSDIVGKSFEILQNPSSDGFTKSGTALSLGCLHAHVGGMASASHLASSVTVLLALIHQNNGASSVQAWALKAIAMIAESGGPMFRDFVEPTLLMTLKLLLRTSHLEVLSSLGQCISAIITTLGPELLEDNNADLKEKSVLLTSISIFQNHEHPVIQAEAVTALQQLHMFAPRTLHLETIVPRLCTYLQSNHFLLRQASVSCLRQFAQRDGSRVLQSGYISFYREGEKSVSSETALPTYLFSMCDVEVSELLVSEIHDTLSSLLSSTASENVSLWLSLLKDVLTVSPESDSKSLTMGTTGEENREDDSDELHAGQSSSKVLTPRWSTRVFAALCLRKIISDCCLGNRAHYDIRLAKEITLARNWKGNDDLLVFHLAELIRMAFMASTSDSDPLRVEGFKILEALIVSFGSSVELEFPNTYILEQYQAQIEAALSSAFSSESSSSSLTSVALDVCSIWITSGVVQNFSDLRRVFNLLKKSHFKLTEDSEDFGIRNESSITFDKLSFLKAMALLYNSSFLLETSCPSLTEKDSKQELLGLLPDLTSHWSNALHDYALLSLPREFDAQLPSSGGFFYSNETRDKCKAVYRTVMPHLLLASTTYSISLSSNNFYLFLGIIVEVLSAPSRDYSEEEILGVLTALNALLNSKKAQRKEEEGEEEENLSLLFQGSFDVKSSVLSELLAVLIRTTLIRDKSSIHEKALSVLNRLLQLLSKLKIEYSNSNNSSCLDVPSLNTDSLILNSLEFLFCLLHRYVSFPLSSVSALDSRNCYNSLLGASLLTLSSLPSLSNSSACSFSTSLLSSIYYLVTTVLLEITFENCDKEPLEALSRLLSSSEKTRKEKEIEIIGASLLKILSAMTGSHPPNEVFLLRVLSVYILQGPLSLLLAPNILTPILNIFSSVLLNQKASFQERSMTYELLFPLFSHSDSRISSSFISSLAPICNYFIIRPNSATKYISSEESFLICKSLDILELLEERSGCQGHFLSPLLSLTLSHCQNEHLFDSSLSRLQSLRVKYPSQFKKIISEHYIYKETLENALYKSENLKRNSESSQKERENETNNNTSSAPTIRLTMDFSKFVTK